MHLYLSQPGTENSLMPTVGLHPWEAGTFQQFSHGSHLGVRGGDDHSHLCSPFEKYEMKLCTPIWTKK